MDSSLQVLWEDGERIFCRRWRDGADGNRHTVLAVFPAAEHPTPASLKRLAHEYALKDELDGAWAVLPLELVREGGRTMLLLEDLEGEPLERLLGPPMEIGQFLRLAVALSTALGRLHAAGLIHKDIKPANVLFNSETGQVRLTGFGIASRLPHERQSPKPPEFIAGTLAYMAPEQTGRMNRSIDSRSDLYALGITLYEILTGSLPFAASDPMEWVHCHIARQPEPPSGRLIDVPAPVSAIILKLLAKTAEDRYQTAAGVEADFRQCVAEWQARRHLETFILGAHDTPDRLMIPEKLYGRAGEIEMLLASFDRVVASGRPEFVLVSGYAGIGKSSVINELHKPLVPPRGRFSSGKFDQYKRDIPYATLAQAFQSLVRPLLSKCEEELSKWRDAMQQALGPNAPLMIDLVPELKRIIGEQPPVPELSPEDAQRRFQLVFGRFISVFARAEHPLVLFLDDLQWLDTATLDLIGYLLTQSDVRHLMLIGAYRDNEVDFYHPLMHKLEAIRQAGATVQEIVLAPLDRNDLQRLIADSLHRASAQVKPLADLVYEKTGGNPFFAIQFISSLAEEGLLTFDHGNGQWSWDFERIHAKGYTDNVVDLMVEKLNRLPIETQRALQQLACIGNSAELDLLATVCQDSEQDIHNDLQEAIRTGLVLHSEHDCRFLHDRVQEAAYSLIPQNARAAEHLRIGRLLASRTAPAEIEENIFEIVNQLNRGSKLVTSAEECARIAELNLVAGRRAKASTAYASALSYLVAGRALLSEQGWDRDHELIFDIECLTAQCELLTAQMAAAESRLSMLAQRARSPRQMAVATRLRRMLYMTLDQIDRAVEVCLEYLRHDGSHWSSHPTSDEVIREYQRIWSQVGSRKIGDLINLPLMTDPDILDVLDVLAEFVITATFYGEAFSSFVTCRMVNLSLQHGNSDGSCFAYVVFAIIVGPRFGNYEAGFRFGQLGYDLVEKRGLKRFQAGTCSSFGYSVLPWTKHVRAGRDLVRHSFDTANRIGDVTSAGICCDWLVRNLLAAGDPLVDGHREAESGLQFVQKLRFGRVADHLKPQLGLIRTLRGLTSEFGSFNSDQFDELGFERYLASDPGLAEPACWYWIRKLQARFFAGDHASAVDAALSVQRRFSASRSRFLVLDPIETAEYHFYGALSHAASWDAASPDQKQQHSEALAAHHRRLVLCAQNGPENFENRAALVGAEIARIDGRALDAEQLYEQAIHSAHVNGFVQNEGLANELAARFYAARGFEKIAQTYLRDARYCYLCWGADGKVRQLDQLYPRLRQDGPQLGRMSTIVAPLEHLDLATVIKVSQAVSGEIVLDKLIETLMRTAIEHAGAERGLLFLPLGNEFRIEAEATTSGKMVVVREASVAATALPESIVHYVVRTHESLILDDASAQNPFSLDAYIHQYQPRSVLCLPLIKQAKLIGVLYLENNLTPNVFTPARMAVLKLLASEAAISLENTRLYSELREREARIRRLVDANIIGLVIWKREGRIMEANEAFLRIVGYGRNDLVSDRVRWTELTPPEWRKADEEALAKLATTGICEPFEKEYFRKDGSRVPVLVGVALLEGKQDEGVAFVLDLTERRRAEESLRESERRYNEAQMELAHANRVTTTGQLTALISHEVKHPIAATVMNASAGLRWLATQPPDLEEVRQTLGRIVADSNRAIEFIGRIHALVNKAPPRREPLDINESILEIIALTRSEVLKRGVSSRQELAKGLPLVLGDRIQLQQVILNLITNSVQAMSGANEGTRELQVGTRRAASGGVLVAVRDSGPGLPPVSFDRLFEAFYTTKPDGLGMGLSICRSIIEAHEGRLWATANVPRGAIFQFSLPAAPDGES
jgi:PAS domain S-box-containing protein